MNVIMNLVLLSFCFCTFRIKVRRAQDLFVWCDDTSSFGHTVYTAEHDYYDNTVAHMKFKLIQRYKWEIIGKGTFLCAFFIFVVYKAIVYCCIYSFLASEIISSLAEL